MSIFTPKSQTKEHEVNLGSKLYPARVHLQSARIPRAKNVAPVGSERLKADPQSFS